MDVWLAASTAGDDAINKPAMAANDRILVIVTSSSWIVSRKFAPTLFVLAWVVEHASKLSQIIHLSICVVHLIFIESSTLLQSDKPLR